MSSWHEFTQQAPELAQFGQSRFDSGVAFLGTIRPDGGPLVVLYGDDLAELAKAVKDAGGRITQPVFAFPGGRRFHFSDPDGYELAVWSAA